MDGCVWNQVARQSKLIFERTANDRKIKIIDMRTDYASKINFGLKCLFDLWKKLRNNNIDVNFY